jgi:hypothetical protein
MNPYPKSDSAKRQKQTPLIIFRPIAMPGGASAHARRRQAGAEARPTEVDDFVLRTAARLFY